MGLLSSIELPHWLLIGGAILTVIGFLGLAFTRNKVVATNPDSEPPAPRSKMPPLLEGTYLVPNAFVLHGPSDPLTKAGRLSPEQKAGGGVSGS
jgi:hypothetical protein